MSSRSILQIMLWHQSLKSIHYRTLLIFQNKKKQIRGAKHGGITVANPGGGGPGPPPPRNA